MSDVMSHVMSDVMSDVTSELIDSMVRAVSGCRHIYKTNPIVQSGELQEECRKRGLIAQVKEGGRR